MAKKTRDARLVIKRTSVEGRTPKIASTDDHTIGWAENEIYTGELYFNMANKKLWIGYGDDTDDTMIINNWDAANGGDIYRESGKVGIGTNDPEHKLHVVGTISGTTFLGDGSQLTGIDPGFWTKSGDDIYRESGNVGIGTDNPQTELHVFGTINATEFIGDGSQLTGIDAGFWTKSGNDIYYNDGNVGIGTDDPPSQKLEVNGSALIQHDMNAYFIIKSEIEGRESFLSTHFRDDQGSFDFFSKNEYEYPEWNDTRVRISAEQGFLVNGNSTFNGTSTFNGNVFVDTLGVNGNTVFSGDITSDLHLVGNLQVYDTSTFYGNSTFNGTSTFNDNSIFNSISTFYGNSIFHGVSTFNGNSFFNNTVEIEGGNLSIIDGNITLTNGTVKADDYYIGDNRQPQTFSGTAGPVSATGVNGDLYFQHD